MASNCVEERRKSDDTNETEAMTVKIVRTVETAKTAKTVSEDSAGSEETIEHTHSLKGKLIRQRTKIEIIYNNW